MGFFKNAKSLSEINDLLQKKGLTIEQVIGNLLDVNDRMTEYGKRLEAMENLVKNLEDWEELRNDITFIKKFIQKNQKA